jgi:hypothetical protein
LTRIVINHLTRRLSPRICVAGIETETETHLRPVTIPEEPLTRDLLVQVGGPLQVGATLELGPTRAQPEPPEIEDHLVDPSRMSNEGLLGADEYLDLIDRVSHRSLHSAFGMALQRRGRSFAVDAGKGKCSLACVRPRKQPTLEVDGFGKLRLVLNDTLDTAYIGVTDLRFYEEDQHTVCSEVFADVHRRILRGVGVWIMFGLARAWQADSDDTERHWLQVNGICLEDSPLI